MQQQQQTTTTTTTKIIINNIAIAVSIYHDVLGCARSSLAAQCTTQTRTRETLRCLEG